MTILAYGNGDFNSPISFEMVCFPTPVTLKRYTFSAYIGVSNYGDQELCFTLSLALYNWSVAICAWYPHEYIPCWYVGLYLSNWNKPVHLTTTLKKRFLIRSQLLEPKHSFNMMFYLTLLTPVSFLTFYSTLESLSASLCSGQITGIALGVPAGLIFCLVLFFLGVLYHRGLAIRRKRAMRRYLESGEVSLFGNSSTQWAATSCIC